MRQTYTAHTLCRQKHNYGGALHVSGDLKSPIRSESAPTPAMAAAPNAADITAMAIGRGGACSAAVGAVPCIGLVGLGSRRASVVARSSSSATLAELEP